MGDSGTVLLQVSVVYRVCTITLFYCYAILLKERLLKVPFAMDYSRRKSVYLLHVYMIGKSLSDLQYFEASVLHHRSYYRLPPDETVVHRKSVDDKTESYIH